MVQRIILYEADLLEKIYNMEDISHIQEVLYEEEKNEKDYNLLDRLFFYLGSFIKDRYFDKGVDVCKNETLSYLKNVFLDYQILSDFEIDNELVSMYLIYIYCGKFDNRKTRAEMLAMVDCLLKGNLIRDDWKIQLLHEKLDILLNSEHLDLGLIIDTKQHLKKIIKK